MTMLCEYCYYGDNEIQCPEGGATCDPDSNFYKFKPKTECRPGAHQSMFEEIQGLCEDMRCGPSCQHTINLEGRMKKVERYLADIHIASQRPTPEPDRCHCHINCGKWNDWPFCEPCPGGNPTLPLPEPDIDFLGRLAFTPLGIEALAEHAYCEYNSAQGIAEKDYYGWEFKSEPNKEVWRTVVRAILDEVKRG